MKNYIVYSILFLSVELVFSQVNYNDSLLLKEYVFLDEMFKEAESDSIKNLIAKAYLNKANTNNDHLYLAKAYNLLAEVNSHTKKGLLYADSIIYISKNIKDNEYPAQGYLQKGIQLYYLAMHSEALENYLKANEFYALANDDYHQMVVEHYIGLLKNNLGEVEEALKIFKKNIVFFNDQKNKLNYRKQYLKSLFALADSYNRNRQLDSAEVINLRGIQESQKTKDNYLYNYFLISYGLTKTFKGEYSNAIDSLVKGKNLSNNENRVIAGSNIIISDTYFGLNDDKKAIEYLMKNDSLYQKNPEIIFQAKETYENLLKYYQRTNNNNNQLKIINKLLAVDSIINLEYNDVGKQIIKQYETPILISEKVKLIDELKENNFLNKKKALLFLILTLIFISVSIFFIRKNIVYKNRFDALLKKQQNINKKSIQYKIINDSDDIGIPDDLINSIIKKLEKFEANNKFTKKTYTLNSLAKELNTNSAYLSKIINNIKKVSFSNYLNELRVDFAIKQLTINKHLRSYTIKAIAQEVGFNSAQSFSVAFYKKNGIYPSYFIKQLESLEKDNK